MPSDDFISWVHFGDLHIQKAEDENYLDFLDLIEDVNCHLAGSVDFAFLPGDNADDGTDAQYRLVRQALDRLTLPVHIITGDHDKKAGTLCLFKKYLEPELYRARTLRGFRLLFLNALDGASPRDFDFSREQINWVQNELREARASKLRPVVFTHLYPSELLNQGAEFTSLIREFAVELVEMGHTHYNELSNDGQTIYSATRSTGQIEEGPPGFSISAIDGDVVSWKFKERGPWPFVMITSPADEKLITRPQSGDHVARGMVRIRARVWGSAPVSEVTCFVDSAPAQAMERAEDHWRYDWNSTEVADGPHAILVRAVNGEGREAMDEISVLVNQRGRYSAPVRHPVDYENTLGTNIVKGILGTQLGPNENGTKGPWPSWRQA